MSTELTAELLALLKEPRIPLAPLLEGDDIVSWEVFKSKIDRGLTTAGSFHYIKGKVSEQENTKNDYGRIEKRLQIRWSPQDCTRNLATASLTFRGCRYKKTGTLHRPIRCFSEQLGGRS